MKHSVNGVDIELREGTADDAPLLLSFIRAMAEFEKLPVTATVESLRSELFGEAPAARVLFAFINGEPAAYATYFFTFSTMVGKRGLWLDDLFVVPQFRGRGIGTTFMAHLAGVAMRHGCGRFEWIVLDWNEKAIALYQRLGASILTEWRLCRLDEAQIPGLAGTLPRTNRD